MSEILIERNGSQLRLILNRPNSGNAIDLPMAKLMLQAAIAAEADPSVRCVVLTGRGRYFCVGGDILDFIAAGVKIQGYLKELTTYLHAAIIRLLKMEKPLVVAVNGPAAGGGMGLALLGDSVIASRSSHFSATYTAIGLTPDCGLSWTLPKLVGLRRAQQQLLRNQRVSADEAASIGLISDVVEDDLLGSAINDQVDQLAGLPTLALGSVRNLLLSSFTASLESQLELESRTIADRAATDAGREGIAAFIEKRKPDFKKLDARS